MRQEEPSAAASGDLNPEAGQYEVTLRALVFPIAAHFGFNLVGALAIWLVGHPWIAAAAFSVAMGADIAQQAIVRRWQKTAAQVGDAAGMNRVVCLTAARTTVALV